MSTGTKSRSGVAVKTFAYETFSGLDSSRDARSQDTGKNQSLIRLDNGYCDWRGQITRDPGAEHRIGEYQVNHVTFYGPNKLAWAEKTGGEIAFNTDDSIRIAKYPINARVSSTVFNRKVHFGAAALPPYNFDGAKWEATKSPSLANLAPAYFTSIQRRLAVSGIPGKETEVHLSRVDNEEVFPDDEADDEVSALRAGYINIANILGTADQITGISSFEQNRLAIFTQDRTFIYAIDPSISNWYLDDRANINIGTISHNSIAHAGTDLLFCSRSGIHSIKRSEDNGIMVYSQSMSDRVEIIYRDLVSQVENVEDISAVFDQDEGQYHVFFPIAGGQDTKKLTLTLNPQSETSIKWSTGDFVKARCGAFLGGQFVLGTPGGLYNVRKVEDITDIGPEMVVQTPILWCGSLTQTKDCYSLSIQAQGTGNLTVEAVDENGRDLGSLFFDVEPSGADDTFVGSVPLSAQYERKFDTRFRGIQLKFTTKAAGLFRLIGFAINIRET